MAIYPCDATRHMYPQPQQSAYRTIVQGNIPLTLTCRLCPRHFRDLQAAAREYLATVDEESEFGTTCDSCGGEQSGIVNLRLFPAKEEEEQLFGGFCAACLERVVAALSVASWRPMAER